MVWYGNTHAKTAKEVNTRKKWKVIFPLLCKCKCCIIINQ